MRICRVPEGEIEAIWPRIENFIEDACSESAGRYEARNIKAFVERSIWQLWCLYNNSNEIIFVGATEIIVYPTGMKSLAWRIGTGTDCVKWTSMVLSHVLREAKLQGCIKSDGCFRKGWRRLPEFRKWKHTHEFLEIDL